MKELLEQCINYVYMDEESEYLVFVPCYGGIGYLVYQAGGDCCSTSWFESINNLSDLLGQHIIGIEVKPEMDGEPREDSRDECVTVYGYTLKTAKGYIDIEFRNSSNGYYGGSCSLVRDAALIFPKIEEREYPKNFDEFTTFLDEVPIFMTIGDSKNKIKLYPCGRDGKPIRPSVGIVVAAESFISSPVPKITYEPKCVKDEIGDEVSEVKGDGKGL